jgi:hypothetical protein
MTNHEQESILDICTCTGRTNAKRLDQQKGDDVGRELGNAVEAFRAGMYGGLTGYRCALTVGSWSGDRQPVFNVEEEYPPVSVS